jgi:hypothetical protein
LGFLERIVQSHNIYLDKNGDLKNMTLYTFGDSWTEGVGGDLESEKKTEIPEERTKIRHLTCWPKYLSDLLGVDFVNMGIGAASNKIIFDSVVSLVKNNTIKKNDLVVIMWSSPLREDVPFFPKDEWHFWGERYKSKEHIFKFILKNTETKNLKYRKFEKEYKEFYLDKIYDESYYNIINQNYIIFLQFLFNKLGINFMFCDAFDSMISKNINTEINKTHFIEKNKYWGFMKFTFRDFLMEKNLSDVWEDQAHFVERIPGKHPNKKGYKIIGDEIYRWIIEQKIIQDRKEEYINIL